MPPPEVCRCRHEQDRRRLADQTERLDNSRRALLHILQDSHRSNQQH